MNVNIKTKISYKREKYSDPSQLPPEVRAALDKAVANGAGTKKVVIINGQELSGQNEDVQKLCDDVMRVIENNGEVTLPTATSPDPLITKRQIQFILALVSALALVAWFFLNR
jgi:hypothetical protein